MRILHRRPPDGDLDFAEFVREVSPRLLRTAFLLSGSQDAAEDLVQEALERACRRWRRISVTEAPEAYARRIVVNLANDRWRRIVHSRESDHAQVPDRPDPRDQYAQSDLHDQLATLLRQLPVGMRSIVVLRYLHDMDYAQIADTLNISTGTVRSQLSRGLSKLRSAIAVTTEDDEPDTAQRNAQLFGPAPLTQPGPAGAALPLGGLQ